MKFKAFIVSVIFVCSLLPGICLAQNKVVVIPLSSEPERSINEIPTVTSAGQVWMDRNLGSPKVAESSNDQYALGWLYQWGRLSDGHQDLSSPTTEDTSNGNVPDDGDFIITHTDWRSTRNDNLWQGEHGVNNPCPSGFRLPTAAEWETERASWGSNQNAASAFASPLKLVVAGLRHRDDGEFNFVDIAGYYWSSTISGSAARRLFFGNDEANVGSATRAYGFSVRCIKD